MREKFVEVKIFTYDDQHAIVIKDFLDQNQ